MTQVLKPKTLVLAGLISMLSVAAYGESPQSTQATLDKTLETSHKTQTLGQNSQKKIDKLAAQTRSLLDEYQKLSQQGEYQRAFNDELAVRQQQQQDEIAALKEQIVAIKMTQQKIQPLLREMAETLALFIQLDLPFQQDQRLQSVEKLNTLLANTQVSNTEKFRRVMELYQTENDYNYDMASYRETVTVADKTLSVELLRVGRSALYFQTLDQQQSAIWLASEKRWQLLEKSYQLAIRQGIRIANQQGAPHLLQLPVFISSDAAQRHNKEG